MHVKFLKKVYFVIYNNKKDNNIYIKLKECLSKR